MDTPIITNPIVDKLTYVLPWAIDCTEEEQRAKFAPVKKLINLSIEAGTCKTAHITKSRYIEKFNINLPSRATALVQMAAVNPGRQNGGINITINPSRLSLEDIHYFHTTMEHLIGQDYPELIKNPRLNRADFAIDILNINFKNLIVNYQDSQKRSVCIKRTGKQGIIEFYSFGSVSSDYTYVAYDKKMERIDKSIRALMAESQGPLNLKENAVKRIMYERNGPEVLRVEVRGKRLGGCRPHELAQVTNRFARFMFSDVTSGRGPELSEFDRRAFLAMARHDGVHAAISLYEKERPEVPVREFWRSKRADWWNPVTAWAESCEALRRSGIFPECAFVAPPVHNLALPASK
ncbi:hypothetical protein [Burkholderia gladioli]|uniref:hypothetical protein n=1 Tax=Burkholderia gladioli TaxID=28095 RepID=UPI0016422D2F|nr:hypothetical protein [Burkholderia gladioli]